MLQDIEPKQFNNEFIATKVPQASDFVVIYSNSRIILKSDEKLPRVRDLAGRSDFSQTQLIYLFSVDDDSFYLSLAPLIEDRQFHYANVHVFRQMAPEWIGFAGITAAQLGAWYENNQICGYCGHPRTPAATERALECAHCGRKLFPTISPAIIVGVTNGDKLLMTKYLEGYQNYALISGFAEVGETLEDTVRREVREEVGLQVHDLQYFGSQPWAFSGTLLVGFFAKVDEDLPINLELDELSQAQWFERGAIPQDDTTLSLTWTMIEEFRNDNVKWQKNDSNVSR